MGKISGMPSSSRGGPMISNGERAMRSATARVSLTQISSAAQPKVRSGR
jgi:hypothetical protein